MKPIFIIGYMGSGKTTFGRALAAELGKEFIDLDFYITQRFRMTVPEIFAAYGEEGFRERERNMLAEVGSMEDVVVSCGGGTPCFFDNMEAMNASGITVFLDTAEDVLHRRLLVRRERRPLLAGKSDDEVLQIIRRGTEERMPYYSKAAIRYRGENLESKTQIHLSVATFLSRHGDKL